MLLKFTESPILVLAVLLLFVLSGFGHQWGWWSKNVAIILFGLTAVASGIIFLDAAINLIRGTGTVSPFFLLKSIGSFGFVSLKVYFFALFISSPRIHDITTDTQNPPSFEYLLSHRAGAVNPPDYPVERFAKIQQKQWPDMETIYFSAAPTEVFDKAVSLVAKRNWKIVHADPESGIIEAYEKLPWFGFVDDIIIRIGFDSETGKSVFDIRSKSRIGRSDLGENARRIRKFIKDLEPSL